MHWRLMVIKDWMMARLKRLHRSFFYWNWFAGKLVELQGNKGKLDGLEFQHDNPYISTALKSRFLFKTYESGAIRLVFGYISPELPVIELGGSIGVVSCFVNRILERPDQHLVVEANSHLLTTLEQKRRINECQFKTINAAVAYGQNEVEFFVSQANSLGGRLRRYRGGEQECVRVPSVSLQSLAGQLEDRCFALIMDIEGAEVALVEHEIDLLADRVSTIVMEVHPQEWAAGRQATNRMLDALADRGFDVCTQVDTDLVLKNVRLRI